MHFDYIMPVFSEGPELHFLSALSSDLERRGLQIALVATTEKIVEVLRLRHTHVHYIYEAFDRDAAPAPDEIREIERKYGLVSLNDHVYPEHAYDWAEPINRLLPKAVNSFRFFERFLKQHTASFFLNNIGGEIVRSTMYRIAEVGGPKSLLFDFAAFPNRFVITTSELGFSGLPACPPKLTAQQEAVAEQLLRALIGERKPFAPTSTLGLAPSNFAGAARATWARAFRDQQDVSLQRLMRERLHRIVRRAAGSLLYEKMKPGERFIFFPLHLGNDTAITLRAPQFQRQEDFIAHLAERALPTGTKLYVKPHIGARDAYPIGMLKQIARLPNVRLIAPTTNPHDLIERADLVVVIGSTVGFEAILHQRPTLVVGRPFYRGLGLTTDVEDLFHLGRAVRTAMDFRPSRDAVLRFLHDYRSRTYPGVYGDTTSENVRLMADAVVVESKRALSA